MREYFINILSIIDSEHIKIFILSMAPITELRFSIPYGILIKDMNPTEVVLLSIIGNILIGLIIVYIIGPIMKFLQNFSIFNNIINYIFKRTLKKGKIVDRIKFWGLVIFVGIPFPLTGVWTGSVAAYLFGIPIKTTTFAIVIGVLISTTIVTLLTIIPTL